MKLLDEIIELTSHIEGKVLDADWAGAAELDLQRRQLLTRLFQSQPGATLDGNSRELLQQLVARNNQAITHIEDGRQGAQAAMRQLNDAPVAMRAYTRNSGPRLATTTGSETR